MLPLGTMEGHSALGDFFTATTLLDVLFGGGDKLDKADMTNIAGAYQVGVPFPDQVFGDNYVQGWPLIGGQRLPDPGPMVHEPAVIDNTFTIDSVMDSIRNDGLLDWDTIAPKPADTPDSLGVSTPTFTPNPNTGSTGTDSIRSTKSILEQFKF